MSQNSKIEWTEMVFNPLRGCTKISPGCKHCYAETFAERWRGIQGHPYEQGFDLRLVPEKLSEPLKRRKPTTYFVNSMSDLFHEGVPFEFIAAVFGVMAATPRHTYQVLTKRPERMREFFAWIMQQLPSCHPRGATRGVLWHAWNRGIDDASPIICEASAWPLPNVWLGVSVEDRKHGLPRIDELRATTAAVRFLSVEPLLEDLGQIDLSGIDWVIVGGESGHGARPMHPDWVRRIRDQVLALRETCADCQGTGWRGVAGEFGACLPCHGRGSLGPALFFKQWGAWLPVDEPGKQDSPSRRAANERWLNLAGGHGFHGDQVWRMRKTTKKRAGRELDGRMWDEMPRRSV